MSAPDPDSDPDALRCPTCLQLLQEIQDARQRMEALERRIAELEARNRDLEATLRRGKRQATPFSRDPKKKPRKRRGRRPGEGRFSSRQPPPDSEVQETLFAPLLGCPACGAAVEQVRTHEQFEVDLPPIRPRWRRYLFQSGRCCACRQRVWSRHPEQVSRSTGAAGVVVGARAKALAADLKHRLGMPLRKSAELLKSAFGLEVTASALCQSNARLARKAEPLYGEIALRVIEAPAVYSDDTGWRIDAEPAWLWVFTTPEATLYAIDSRRSHAVVEEILSENFAGVLVTDCAPAFNHRDLAAWTQQKCLAHLLKDLRQLEEKKTKGAVRFPRAVTAVLRDALALGREREALEAEVFAARRQQIEARLDRLIEVRRHFTDPDNARLAKRLRKHRDHLFIFLQDPAVEATNNRAERMLRPAVITRKTGGCNRSRAGARTHEILASVLVTLRQQGHDLLGCLQAVLTAPGALPDLWVGPTPQTV